VTQPLLRLEEVSIAYGGLEAVREVSFAIMPGEIYGLVGESGSGKTSLALAIMGWLGESGRVQAGEITFGGQSLVGLSRRERERLWGRRMALVPQNPQTALNPAMKIEAQVGESLTQHTGLRGTPRRQRVLELLDAVRLPDPERAAASYPHQLSGGMQQRVLIALALSGDPELLVLDEPTTSLDVTTQAEILALLQGLIRERGTSALYVTHNLGVVARVCGRVGVLYAGELVEEAPRQTLFQRPLHPYTRGLLESVPRLGQNQRQARLPAIPGRIPPLGARPEGCVFITRCPLAVAICHQRPPLYQPAPRHGTRCHRWEALADGTELEWETAPAAPISPEPVPTGEPALGIDDLHVSFDRPGMVLPWRKPPQTRAVAGVSLQAGRGVTVGLVGESGSGKTSLARATAGLVEPRSGRIELLGEVLPPRLGQRGRDVLRQIQMVFQNPEEAFTPHLNLGESLSRPFITLMGRSRAQAAQDAARLLEMVGLPPEFSRRYPHQLSGGEKQRAAIARAFAASPDLLLADEPVSSLDVSVQAVVLNLLSDLQAGQQSTLLFISHDLAVVGYLADVIAVMYRGHLMEVAPAPDLFQPPHHPYTAQLMAAIPVLEPGGRETAGTESAGPGPGADQAGDDETKGCPFHQRCPRYLGPICAEETPPWQEVGEAGKRYFCHIPPEAL
jgi:peptide/nickel transport system ATP-binding protein